MQLTGAPAESGGPAEFRWRSPVWSTLVVLALLVLVGELDRRTGSAPVQHLYYLPIILAALNLRMRGGLLAAAGAIVLYHLANPHLLTARYEQSDIVQMTLFAVVGMVTAKLRRDAERLRRLAMTDDLTGLHNLRSFEAELMRLLKASQDNGTPIALLVLDLDRLKSLNDVHGHLAGAEAVRTVGSILAARLSATSVASRYGGDEFVVALPGISQAGAADIADGLRRAVSTVAPVLVGKPFPVATLTISIGVAWLPRVGPDVAGSDEGFAAFGEAFFRAADEALYRAKAGGRNQICIDKAMQGSRAGAYIGLPSRA